jgi:hypothetical protein
MKKRVRRSDLFSRVRVLGYGIGDKENEGKSKGILQPGSVEEGECFNGEDISDHE